jgi:two-component system, OmpR family, osmolarity sensor histidine kinase EnvZ
MAITKTIKRFLPRSLLGRSLMIIVTPLVLLQVVSAVIFYESHWDKVSMRLARGLAGDVAVIVDLLERDLGEENQDRVFRMASGYMEIVVVFEEGAVLANVPPSALGRTAEGLVMALEQVLDKPLRIDASSLERSVIIEVQLLQGVVRLITTRKRLFSSTTYVFVLWMVGTSLILFGVATVFMRNQVRPIRRLARAADAFGKGREVERFKPEGAKEVRQAASAFIAMRKRIQRQITQRTEMLAGVSHDLRTPLTRMKLQLALLEVEEGAGELKKDVAEMEHMIEGYLAFARGEGSEAISPTRLNDILGEVVAQSHRQDAKIKLHCEEEITLPLRPNAFKRCLTNIVENALRYGENVSLRAARRGGVVEITIDDDGPGIPEDQREEVFRPFFRIDKSRNPETGGVGLGMTIARDVARSHGGDISLGSSPAKGLRVRLRLPL